MGRAPISLTDTTTTAGQVSFYISSKSLTIGCLTLICITAGLCLLGLVLNYGKKQRKLQRNRTTTKDNNRKNSHKNDDEDDVKNNNKENPDRWIGFSNKQFRTS